ncbi:MAG: hypothetical protein OER21_09385 [Gemmatimonadota bacterium]|nr:hypothetical protein [Gemmatimonadota bacterium]
MARMYPLQAQVYPQTANWLRQARDTIPRRDGGQIWRAFLRYGQFTPHEATRVLTWGEGPFVRIVRLKKLGLFVPQAPTAVMISRSLARAYERAPRVRRNQLALEAIVLHELVHWGDWRDGIEQPDVRRGRTRLDVGDQFEVAAYGFNVGQASSFGMYILRQQQAQERARDRQFDDTFGSPLDI